MSIQSIVEKLDHAIRSVVALTRGDPMSDENQLPQEPEAVPLELGGKWLAWSADGLRIVAHGDTLDECRAAATTAGEIDPCFEKSPPADVRLLGASH